MAKEKETALKVPPQSLEAEQSVLGALLLDTDAIVKIIDSLQAKDFYKFAHEKIYEAIVDLYNNKEPIDLVTLTNRLEEKKLVDEVGGSSYLVSLVESTPTAINIVSYAQIVHQKATLRRLLSAANEIVGLAFQEDTNIDEILDKSESALFGVSQKYLKQNFINIKEALSESFERLDKLHQDKEKIRGIPTGFNGLDSLLAGLQAGDLVVLAARPSMGKSAFALNIAYNCAKEGSPVGIFSLEMSTEQIIDRFYSLSSGIDSWKLRTGNLNDTDFDKIGVAMGHLAEVPIFIDDSPIISVMDMRAKARRLQSESGLGLIIVDYLQLLESKKASDSRVQEISEITRALKAMAKELGVPVLALSQLSRNVEMRSPKIPQLADLRESGSIEQDADVVMFIYRDEYYNKETEKKNIADILIRKHRNGPTGDVELYFQSDTMKFGDVDKKHETTEVMVEEF